MTTVSQEAREAEVTQADIDAAQAILDIWFNRSVIETILARHRQSAERDTLARMEPVAWMYCTPHGFCDFHEKRPANPSALTDAGWIETPLYTLPTPPEAVRTPIEGTSHDRT